MNFNELFPLHVNNLTITSLFSLNKSTIELVKPYICELGPVARAALEHLELAQQNLEISLNKNQESMFTVAAYIQFCTAIEQAVNYTPTDTLVALFNKMDELRKKYHAVEDTKEKASTETPL